MGSSKSNLSLYMYVTHRIYIIHLFPNQKVSDPCKLHQVHAFIFSGQYARVFARSLLFFFFFPFFIPFDYFMTTTALTSTHKTQSKEVSKE